MENVKTKILLVEDDPSLGPLLQEYLDAKGFETKLADDGKKEATSFQRLFRFAAFDVMMPVKDGISLAKEIRVVDKNVPIISSPQKYEGRYDRGFNAGADDYIKAF